jgi:hypothetical protein
MITAENTTMNHYGLKARQHWARHLPRRFAAIQDPDQFFTQLGNQAAEEISDLTLQLAGDDQPGEGFLVKMGRLNMARLRAEEMVLPQLILLPGEPETEDPDSQP